VRRGEGGVEPPSTASLYGVEWWWGGSSSFFLFPLFFCF
jgi:hypothetical protein